MPPIPTSLKYIFHRAWSMWIFVTSLKHGKHGRLGNFFLPRLKHGSIFNVLEARQCFALAFAAFTTVLEARKNLKLSHCPWNTWDCLTSLVSPGTLSQCMNGWYNRSVSLRLKYNGTFFFTALEARECFFFLAVLEAREIVSPCL